jgi:hypothetical protein
MLRSSCPERLWDDCIIREAYVRSHTALDIFGLEGQVPESKVKGEPVDISTIAEYSWYEWVKFRDTAASFPVSKIQLGKDSYIGHSKVRKILKANRKVVYRTSCRYLTPDGIQSPTELKAREAFNAVIEEMIGPSTTEDDFKDDPDYADLLTPVFEPLKMTKSLLPRCRTLMMTMISMTLIPMISMLGPKLGYLLGMRSTPGR